MTIVYHTDEYCAAVSPNCKVVQELDVYFADDIAQNWALLLQEIKLTGDLKDYFRAWKLKPNLTKTVACFHLNSRQAYPKAYHLFC